MKRKPWLGRKWRQFKHWVSARIWYLRNPNPSPEDMGG